MLSCYEIAYDKIRGRPSISFDRISTSDTCFDEYQNNLFHLTHLREMDLTEGYEDMDWLNIGPKCGSFSTR